jgi:hypothetical protein
MHIEIFDSYESYFINARIKMPASYTEEEEEEKKNKVGICASLDSTHTFFYWNLLFNKYIYNSYLVLNKTHKSDLSLWNEDRKARLI